MKSILPFSIVFTHNNPLEKAFFIIFPVHAMFVYILIAIQSSINLTNCQKYNG